MKKKLVKNVILVAISAMVLAGCGSEAANQTNATTESNTQAVEETEEVTEEAEETTEVTETEETTETTETEETTETTEDTTEEESDVASPFEKDLEMYDSVISELTEDQYYAFADICSDYDILLVSDGAFDNGDGNMASVDAKLYAPDADNNIREIGIATGGNTAYPLACKDGYLFTANNDRIMVDYYDAEAGSMITKKCSEVSYDTDGNATYHYFDLDTEFEGEVEDDTEYNELLDLYSETTVINFQQAGANN